MASTVACFVTYFRRCIQEGLWVWEVLKESTVMTFKMQPTALWVSIENALPVIAIRFIRQIFVPFKMCGNNSNRWLPSRMLISHRHTQQGWVWSRKKFSGIKITNLQCHPPKASATFIICQTGSAEPADQAVPVIASLAELAGGMAAVWQQHYSFGIWKPTSQRGILGNL